ncbi:MAG: Coenzyme F420 hydrogenase/dehydrogenase, beta subunit C-terminal domain [Chloroflexota bacterium]
MGRATDDAVYTASQSGGVVTALLLHALRQKLVEGAVVTVTRPGRPPMVEPTIATTEQGIIDGQRSKYLPVPLLKVLKDVEARQLTVAVVGLPCHLHGLYNLVDARPVLDRLIPIRIGLVCDRVMTMAGRDFLISCSGLDGELRDLRFRDKLEGGWPGNVKAVSADGQSVVLPARARMSIKDAFTPARCRLCFDKLNIFADLTAGDPWGIASADKVNGESVVVARTLAGSEFLKEAVNRGALLVRPIQYDEVVEGQKIEQRRREWRGYCEAWRGMGLELPEYHARVAAHTPQQGGKGTYLRGLQRALALDQFQSREQLLWYVERSLVRRGRRRRLLLPIRLARGMIRRAHRGLRRGVPSLLQRPQGRHVR